MLFLPWRVRFLWCFLSTSCLTQSNALCSFIPQQFLCCPASLLQLFSVSLEPWLHFPTKLFSRPIRLPNIHSCLIFVRLSVLSTFSICGDPLHLCSFLSKLEGFFQFRCPLMQSSGPLALPHIFFLSILSFGEPVLSAFYCNTKQRSLQHLFW